VVKNYLLISFLIISALLGATKAYLDYRLPIELNKTLEKTALPISYAETYLTLLGAIKINNVQFNTFPLKIEALTLHHAYRFYDVNSLPTFMRLTAQKIQIPISDESSTPPPLLNILGYATYYLNSRELRELGYTTLQAELDITAKQTTENRLVISGLFTVMQVGKLTLRVELENVPPPMKWTNTTFLALPFTQLIFNYSDDDFMKRVFSFLAQRNKMTAVQLKQTLKTKVITDLKQSGLTFDESVLTSLQEFIQNPETLTISLQPPTPLSIEKLEKLLPTILLKALGLTMDTQ
jgi:hypothetical protein